MENPLKDKKYYLYNRLPTGLNAWNPYVPICRYLQFDTFIGMVKQHKFFVNIKQNFVDQNEIRLPLKGSFSTHICGRETSKEIYKDEIKKDTKRRIEYKNYNFMPTSCWTLQTNENYLMWKAYAPNMGVRIKTNVDKLLSSLSTDNFDVLCGYIFYDGYGATKDVDDCLFSKTRSFSDEREFRIYFQPQNDEQKKAIEEN